MLPFDYCWPMRPSTRASRAHLSSVCFRKVLRKSSLHRQCRGLVSSVTVGLTFKDFLTTFHLVCHVLLTNRSCQTKGPKSKTEHMSAWIAYHTDPLECKTYIWLDVHYGICFLPSWKLAVIVNLLPVLLVHQRKINAGLARKVAVSKFNWVFWSCESFLIVCSHGAVTARNPWIPVFLWP